MFAKYQRTLIPYFRQYMIPDVKESWDGKTNIEKSISDKSIFKNWNSLTGFQQNQMKFKIMQVATNSEKDKIDKRILKNL